ncbi:class I SAM-dependent methyltransferase [Propylenella binzhouense]|uniref:Class I SAM-dependent methyltransferase n=1 Tax=Propylenella binzhouense TaxID=2555902 RepID=A0A964T2K3_9HYPH|nr:class I SAM-dependent methyltransferase [Propylenella binzhouense]MYZ47321.1 class I SAM-dependent methyltransferase [Propylenella binzhouense]
MSVESPLLANPALATNPHLEAGRNPFMERFGSVPEPAWEEALLAAISKPVSDGLAFPLMPPAPMQERIHGHSNEHSMREAFAFRHTVMAAAHALGNPVHEDMRLLDFGSGWGRILRPYLRDLKLENIYGFEPNPWFCHIARSLNPYVTFVNGPPSPPSPFRNGFFDLTVSWSVFSHLPRETAAAWLQDFARTTRPGGLIFITTWGARFLELLEGDAARLAEGGDIHWYHRMVIEAIGDLTAMRARLEAGEFVFVASHPGNPLYGEAFMPEKAARALCTDDLELVLVNQRTLPQDLFVYRRDGAPKRRSRRQRAIGRLSRLARPLRRRLRNLRPAP